MNNIRRKLNNTFDKIEDGFEDAVDRVENTTNVLINGRGYKYSPNVTLLLNKIGDEVIIRLSLNRDPVPAMIQSLIQKLSGGKIEYDRLFHLRLNIYTSNGGQYILEKNEVVNISRGIPPSLKHGEMVNIRHSIQPVTITNFLQNTRNLMGSKSFFSYSPSSNYCQDFIVAVLKANGLNIDQYIRWIKQNTKQVFHGNDALRKIANSTIDIAKIGDIIVQGGSINSISEYPRINARRCGFKTYYKK